MPALFYIRLIALAAGAQVYLFLMALILGHRRPRALERLLFFLTLSIFLIYAGGLLEINARIQYGVPLEATRAFYDFLIAAGEVFLPALLLHTFLAYARLHDPKSIKSWMVAVFVAPFYLGAFADPIVRYSVISRSHFLAPLLDLKWFLAQLAPKDEIGLTFAIIVCIVTSFAILKTFSSENEKHFFQWLVASEILVAIPLILRTGIATLAPIQTEGTLVAVLVAGILPGCLLGYWAIQYNFLEYGAQRNLVYALAATFLALLYLALVHRVSGWLEPVLPREAAAAILLFVLIFLFEPLERAIGPRLHRAFGERMAHVQRVSVEIQREAGQGDVARLIGFVERRVREEFGLAALRLTVRAELAGSRARREEDPGASRSKSDRDAKPAKAPTAGAELSVGLKPHASTAEPLKAPGGLGHAVRIPLLKDGKEIGVLEGASTGTYLTGETSAALEFLSEQLPGMLDLCRLIEEKLQLERALAERERLALLGQMAASVSHNLRNPLSSMKTILQVQLENPDLPLDVRHDCALVVGEIDRMGDKLKQLLNFAKPSVNRQSVPAVTLARQTAALFARDAERRNVRLEFDGPEEEVRVTASEEALNEVLSNLIVNAIEAQPNGGRVRVGVSNYGTGLEVRVEDDGPGVNPEVRARIFQPYFTTKASGTGLGLAIVGRRVEEMGGTIACESPISVGKGTRFVVRMPAKEAREGKEVGEGKEVWETEEE